MTLVTAVLVIVGASLVLMTVSTNWSEAVALLPSVQVNVIVCVPTLAFNGVPVRSVPEIVMVLGLPDTLYVHESPESTSENTLEKSNV